MFMPDSTNNQYLIHVFLSTYVFIGDVLQVII